MKKNNLPRYLLTAAGAFQRAAMEHKSKMTEMNGK